MQPIAGLPGQGRWAGGATICRSRLKSLTQHPRIPGTALPRGRNSACRGEWRREPGSPKKAPNAGSGKRVWRTPTPICPCPAGWPRRGICFSYAGFPAFFQDLMPAPKNLPLGCIPAFGLAKVVRRKSEAVGLKPFRASKEWAISSAFTNPAPLVSSPRQRSAGRGLRRGEIANIQRDK